MEWRKCYLDVTLVPSGFLINAVYHAWLWHQVKTHPLTTIIGTNMIRRRFWVSAIMKDNDKKNILAVQTLRNMVMGSTLMATTSILLSTGLAAVLSSTYSTKKPLSDTAHGPQGEFAVALKYETDDLFSDYVSQLLEKGLFLNVVGNRLFYLALPLLLWIFGPVLVLICSATMAPVLYNLDLVRALQRRGR